MRDWFKQKHHEVAFWIWSAGLVAAYLAARNYTFAGMTHSLHGLTLLSITITAIPLGWGILKQSPWAKWGVLAVLILLAMDTAVRVASAPNLWNIVGLVFVAWCIVSLIRWDITSRQELAELVEWARQHVDSLAPPPLAPCSVDLIRTSGMPVSQQVLATAVTQAFGRKCAISHSTDNIDLGVEAGMTTADTAIVGGGDSEHLGHLIVGAHPVSIDVVWVPLGGEESGTVLTIGTPRQFARSESEIDGYDWTIPLAAALWSENTTCAKLENENQSLNSAAELLGWHANRKRS